MLADAVETNTRLKAAEARHAAGLSELALARRAWFPAIFVGAEHAYVQNKYLVHETMNMLTAGMSWNLFDGGARKADIHRAEAAAAAMDRDRLEVGRAVRVAVDDAWRRWEQAHRELATARADVEATGENLRIVEDQYREGVARSNDVLDAETMLARARYDVVRRHYQTYRAQADLLTAAGRDLSAFYEAAPAGAGED
jgi:outer membrane protein TolC